MGSSDPFPARFEIRFGSLNFQATGNGYHMRITNRDELHPWRSTGPGPVPVTLGADAPAPVQADAVGPSTSQRRRRSGQRARQAWMERRRTARVASQRDATTGGMGPLGDLVRTFVGNFQGTYVRPGNSWDLRTCTQKPGESLRDFKRRFSKHCSELPSVAQSEIVHAFLEGTTCRDLVRELGRSHSDDSNKLVDNATSFASGEEAVWAIFDGKKGKRVDNTLAEGSKSKEPQQKHKRGKKGKKLRHEAREQGRDNDGDEALTVDPARRGPRAAPRGPGVFDDMLKKPCLYHKMPVNHTLEQCDLLKRYYSRAAAKDGEAKKDGGDDDAGGIPAVENVFLIFGGPTVDMSNSQRKREWHEVLAAEKAPPSFLDWSEDAITFSREDHTNRIPNPDQYPLVVDPVIGNAHFSKVLIDGGSSLNILYAHTLHLLGIGLDQVRPSTTPFHGVASGKRVQPLGQIDLPARRTTSARRLSPSRWWGSGAHTTPFSGGRATPNSWQSQTTPTSR
jgi:hypothetical protein